MKNKQIRILLTLDQVYDKELYDYFADINPRNRATQVRINLKGFADFQRAAFPISEVQNPNQAQLPNEEKSVLSAFKKLWD